MRRGRVKKRQCVTVKLLATVPTLWVLQSCFNVYFWHTGHDWYPGYCSHLMLIRVHYSVNNHHVVRPVLEEASLKKGNKSVHKTWCVIIQHTWWKKSKVYFSHGTIGQKLYEEKHGEHTSSHRHHQMSARNVGSVCSYETNISAYFRQGDPLLSSVTTSARKCEHLTFLECPGMHWCNSNCFCSSVSIQGRSFDTIYHKFSLVWKIWWHKPKGCLTH